MRPICGFNILPITMIGVGSEVIERIGKGDFTMGVNLIAKALLTWEDLPELTKDEVLLILDTMKKQYDCGAVQEFMDIKKVDRDQQVLFNIARAIPLCEKYGIESSFVDEVRSWTITEIRAIRNAINLYNGMANISKSPNLRQFFKIRD